MILQNINAKTGGFMQLYFQEASLERKYNAPNDPILLTIAWNSGDEQQVTIDGIPHVCLKNSIVTLMANQSFSFEYPEQIVAWQFNKQFYCIIDHDKEVGCAGLIFYGIDNQPIIQLAEEETKTFRLLYEVFKEEFYDQDSLQEDMLRMLLKRLIIKVTRLYKNQIELDALPREELDIIRQYTILVAQRYKEWHQVQDYANELNKSPKTLSNLFSQAQSPSPIKIIHNRIIQEAKRLLRFTDMSIKEIAYNLGFSEVPHFNRLFKKMTELSPSLFRKTITSG